jgi:formylglycine-generating enzyme required for sulfatase activity/predicted Ser/Thr protein kinase
MLERDIFIAAWDIEDATGRRAYLDSVCLNNAALRNRLERLLSHARDNSDFLDQPAADLCSDWDSAWLAESSGIPQPEGEFVTQNGAAGDTGQTVLLSPAVPAASVSSAEVLSFLQLGTLFGRYRVERVLGTGGMGIVYLAEDLRLGRHVALKISKFDVDGKLHLIERFRREARTMALVLHRHLCPIYDVAEQDGQHYLTMAFIDGETLGQALKRGATFSTRQIAELVRKLALALEAAHQAGVVHRDLKPANVMLDRSGEPIIMDFGLAWMVHETDSRVTQSGAIIGTPAYMSPEQAEGGPDKIGAASDIYSLGAMLYELLAGRPIYAGSVTHVLYQLRHDDPTRPSVIRRDIDPQLEAICWKAISRRPEDRYATAGEFAEALEGCREGEAHAEPHVRRTSSSVELATDEDVRRTPPPQRGRRTALAGFAALVLLAAVLLITTRSGTVVVTSPDGKLPEDIKVVVTRGGEEIELLQADNQWSAKLLNGEYQVQLRGGGDRFEITTSQLTIHRLGRAVVKLEIRPPVAVPPPNSVSASPATPRQEPIESAKPAAPVDVGKPFVVVREAQEVRAFKTLSGAINELRPGDVIEIRTNERLPIQGLEPVIKPLTIRAGTGYRPWLVFVGQGTCAIRADFSVEGCDLDLRSAPFTPHYPKDTTWRFHRCRLWGDPAGFVSRLRVGESVIISVSGNSAPTDGTVTDYEFDNCLIHCCNTMITYSGSSSHTLRMRNCTFYAVAGGYPRLAHLREKSTLTIEATGNVFHCQSQSNELIDPRCLPQVTWIGANNCFSGTWYQIREGNVLKEKGLSAWNKLWKESERDSREVDLLAFEWGRIQRLSNPERSLAVRAATEKMIAEHKLPEVGPDWNLVGPGAAYVRALAAEGRAVPESELRPERREDGPVVLMRGGKEVRGYLTLKPALDAAQTQDVIELRTDGLVQDSSWTGDSRLLTIRAGAGYTPTIDSRLESSGTDQLILEGLTIRHVLFASGGVLTKEPWSVEHSLYPTRGSILRMMNCAGLAETNKNVVDAWLIGDGKTIPEIVNCNFGILRIGISPDGRARLRNSVVCECRPNVESRTAPPGRLEIERCVFWRPEPAQNVAAASLQANSPITVQAHCSIFVSPVDLTFGHPLPIVWTGSGNVFVKPYVFRYGQFPLQLDQFQTQFHTEADSIELPPWEFDPAQWRILRDKSPGYQPRPDGADYGADIDRLVLGLDRNTARGPVAAPPRAIAPFDATQAKAHQAAWAQQFGVPVEYTNTIGMKLVLIPPGEFMMGSTPAEIDEASQIIGENEFGDRFWQRCTKSEGPQHQVILTKPFYLGVHEVTQAEYESVMGPGSNPSAFAPQGEGSFFVAGLNTADHPVEKVSWNAAAEFCAKLSRLEKFPPFYSRADETVTPLARSLTLRGEPTGAGYRLPTEAEWEFACRAGTTTKFSCDERFENLESIAWLDRNSRRRTHAVGELKGNSFGLHDMHGNVWEYVEDAWEQNYFEQFRHQPAIDPIGPPVNDSHVLKGGHWRSTASICRASNRTASSHEIFLRQNCAGFRVALDVIAVKAAIKERAP